MDAAKKKRGGRMAGAKGYSAADVSALLTCVEKVQPVGKRDWEAVLRSYRESYAAPNARAPRHATAIQGKFRILAKPTGDPTQSPMVARALAIAAAIQEKAAMVSRNGKPDRAPVRHEGDHGHDTAGCTQSDVDSNSDSNSAVDECEGGSSGDDYRAETNGEGASNEEVLRAIPSRSEASTSPSSTKAARTPAKRNIASAFVAAREETNHGSIARRRPYPQLLKERRNRAVSSAEELMALELVAAYDALDYERTERHALATKVLRLEEKADSLADQKKQLRDRIFDLESEIRWLRDRCSPVSSRFSTRPYAANGSHSRASIHSPYRAPTTRFGGPHGRRAAPLPSRGHHYEQQRPHFPSMIGEAGRERDAHARSESGLGPRLAEPDRHGENGDDKKAP